jgi:hypothetical protein
VIAGGLPLNEYLSREIQGIGGALAVDGSQGYTAGSPTALGSGYDMDNIRPGMSQAEADKALNAINRAWREHRNQTSNVRE